MPGQVVDYLPAEQLAELRNLTEFAGILALDKWTGNANGRQAVFTRRARERRYRAVFIDYGYCFHAGEWRFQDAPLRGVYHRNDVYTSITGWDTFEPWLTRVETKMDETALDEIQKEIPPAWYGHDFDALERMLSQLLRRRRLVRELLVSAWKSTAQPFPNWK